ncbi:hypothetical protein QC763_0011330 [Podospora pseudopauciseta]|uniref:Uncharacterized protein n=1 Tax=Podospora pseudopauciseta TaxID=2093780 RepID=A0ABR0HYZ3_9PEZI|nr:hypothetical protein QC763_0011330 [Podospora pseudopauciseta]
MHIYVLHPSEMSTHLQSFILSIPSIMLKPQTHAPSTNGAIIKGINFPPASFCGGAPSGSGGGTSPEFGVSAELEPPPGPETVGVVSVTKVVKVVVVKILSDREEIPPSTTDGGDEEEEWPKQEHGIGGVYHHKVSLPLQDTEK